MRATALVAPALLLAACGIGGGSGGGDAATMAGPCELSDEVTSGEPVTGEPQGEIVLQTTALKSSFSEYFDGVIDAFEKKYPGVTVTWQDDPGDATFTQRLVTDAQSCALPDVLNLNQTTAYALYKENFLLDLSTAAPDAGADFIPSLWDSMTFPGSDHHYVMPWYWGLLGIQTFNTDLMTKVGLDPSTPPTTIMEQFDQSAAVAEGSDGQAYAFAANPFTRVPSDWQFMDAAITTEDESEFTFADDPKVLAWVQKYAELYRDGALPKDTLSSDVDVTQLYSAGDVVWGSSIPSYLRYVQETNETTYGKTGVAPLLDARGAAIAESQLVAVPSTSKNPATALAFARFLLDPENQKAFVSDERVSNFPSTTDSMDIPKFTDISGDTPLDQANRLSVELSQEATNAFIYNWSDAVQSAVVSELQLAISGKKGAQEALDAAQEKANRILADQD
ncbi:extracellular solute-binding protein [Isoptericola sp. NPDC057559]|uniref:extracellular solute-binding protein n=1 Tax=Isoptericola sp. NPDC057559 TaxID=3346168 RepID=UPI00369E64D4